MNLADFPFLNCNFNIDLFIQKAKKRNNLEMVDQDKEDQLKSYMDRLPPPTQAELEALASYSSMFLAITLVVNSTCGSIETTRLGRHTPL